ncbi:MAG: hypothetical protein JJU28_23525 [Cyclobacteriaceae bacterium]|nr:hypothetical protein [Cyclobacteriaceae bacterium]
MKKANYFFILIVSLSILFINDAISGHKYIVHDDEGNVLYHSSKNLQLQDAQLHINSKGLTKLAFDLPYKQKLQWISHYGSVTYNYLGKEFPHGGMNETGLSIQLIDQKFQGNDLTNTCPVKLNVFQWIQYQLDNFSCITAILQNVSEVGYSEPEGVKFIFFVADAQGKTALISTKNGSLVSTHYNGHKASIRNNRLSKLSRVRGIKAKTVSYYENIVSIPQFHETSLLVFTPSDYSLRYFSTCRTGNIYLNLKSIDFSSDNTAFYMNLSRDVGSNPYETHFSNYEINFRQIFQGAKDIYYLKNHDLDYCEAMAAYPGSMTFVSNSHKLTQFIE